MSFHSLDSLKRALQYVRGQLHRKWCCSSYANTSVTDNWDITVVIIVRNMRDGLWRAMDSAAIALDHLTRHVAGNPRVGLLVLDDASSDDSRAEAMRFADQSPVPTRVVSTCWHVGVTRARNLALDHVSSPLLFFLDADNTLVPEGLTRLHAVLAEHPDAALVHGAMRVISRHGILDDRMGMEAFEHARGLAEGPMHDISGLYRLKALRTAGGFDESLLLRLWGFEDFDLWMRLTQSAPAAIVHTPLLVGVTLRSAEGHWAQRTTRTLGRAQRVFERRFGPGFTAYKKQGSSDPVGPLLD